MKVLVIAQEGQIRAALEQQLTSRGRNFECVTGQWCDLASLEASLSNLTRRADIGVVVNAKAVEYPDGQSESEALAALSALAQYCEARALPLLQLSAGEVFGSLSGRHREDDAMTPTSERGKLLLQMEALIQLRCSQHVIVRTSPLFSGSGENLLTALLHRFQQAEALSLSNEGRSCPLHTADLARVLSAIIDQLGSGASCWGTYHYSSSDPVTHYQYAETVLAVVSQYAQAHDQPLSLEPVAAADASWPQPLLNCDKILNTFGIKQLPWRSYVVPTVKTFFQQQAKS